MNLPITCKINQKNHLEIGGCDLAALAARFGTPLYVLDEKTLRQNCRRYLEAFRKNYPANKFSVAYASKALCLQAVLKIVAQEGLGLDVVSGGELFTAQSVNFPGGRIFFHGNNKSITEIQQALKARIGYFVIDNVFEFENILKNSRGQKVRAYLRVVPEIKAHTHSHITTGHKGSKFGLKKEEAFYLIKKARKTPIEIVGLHAHIGSQITDLKTFETLAEKMVLFLKEVRDKTGVLLSGLNLGGGLAVVYLSSDQAPKIEDYVKTITNAVKKKCSALRMPLPNLSVEPGRSIVGPAGVTIYQIGAVKKSGDLKIVSVDGGMSDNPRPILYDAAYEAILAANPKGKKTEKVLLAGKFCESGDILIKKTFLPDFKSGDLVVVPVTGAYNYSMASNYNRVGRPAMVLVSLGLAATVLERENYRNLVRQDRLPNWLTRKK